MVAMALMVVMMVTVVMVVMPVITVKSSRQAGKPVGHGAALQPTHPRTLSHSGRPKDHLQNPPAGFRWLPKPSLRGRSQMCRHRYGSNFPEVQAAPTEKSKKHACRWLWQPTAIFVAVRRICADVAFPRLPGGAISMVQDGPKPN